MTAQNSPWLVGTIDLSVANGSTSTDRSGQLAIRSGSFDGEKASLLVVHGATTCGYCLIDIDGLDATGLIERALSEIGLGGSADTATLAAPARGWETGCSTDIFASVIICTLGSNPLLVPALEAVLAQTHTNFELVIVDNNPSSHRVDDVLAKFDDSRIRVVQQPQRGLSNARNAGVAAAKGDYIAFTDDDATVCPTWLSAILDVFVSADKAGHPVGGVTGPAFPAQLDHDSQKYFEARGGFPKATQPYLWNPAGEVPVELLSFGAPGEGGPLFPVTTARVGAGVNMAFSRQALADLGSFDTALGAGAATLGGEDLDAFARALRKGHIIVTNPDAVVHHVHRQDLDGLVRQTYGDGTGMAALLTKAVVTNPKNILVLGSRVMKVAKRVNPKGERFKGNMPDVPSELGKSEVKGFLRGPLLYAHAVWEKRR